MLDWLLDMTRKARLASAQVYTRDVVDDAIKTTRCTCCTAPTGHHCVDDEFRPMFPPHQWRMDDYFVARGETVVVTTLPPQVIEIHIR